jgi:hypothetical protein
MRIYIWQNDKETIWYIHLELDNWIYQLRGKTDDLFKRSIISDQHGHNASVVLNKLCQLEVFYQMKLYTFNLSRDNRQGDKEMCVLQGTLINEDILHTY